MIIEIALWLWVMDPNGVPQKSHSSSGVMVYFRNWYFFGIHRYVSNHFRIIITNAIWWYHLMIYLMISNDHIHFGIVWNGFCLTYPYTNNDPARTCSDIYWLLNVSPQKITILDCFCYLSTKASAQPSHCKNYHGSTLELSSHQPAVASVSTVKGWVQHRSSWFAKMFQNGTWIPMESHGYQCQLDPVGSSHQRCHGWCQRSSRAQRLATRAWEVQP